MRYLESNSPSYQIAIIQSVRTVTRGSASDSNITRRLSRDRAMPEALRIELVVLDLAVMT
jgi:hypothetical protein